MNRKPQTVKVTDDVQDAAKLMVERKIGCLPVLEGGKLVGIVTKDDLLRLLSRAGV
jgi:acetoin utilization protein AcuB